MKFNEEKKMRRAVRQTVKMMMVTDSPQQRCFRSVNSLQFFTNKHHCLNQTSFTTNPFPTFHTGARHYASTVVEKLLDDAENHYKRGDFEKVMDTYQTILHKFSSDENKEAVTESMHGYLQGVRENFSMDRFERILNLAVKFNLFNMNEEFTKIAVIVAQNISNDEEWTRVINLIFDHFTSESSTFYIPIVHSYLLHATESQTWAMCEKMFSAVEVSAHEMSLLLTKAIKKQSWQVYHKLIQYVGEKDMQFTKNQLQFRLCALSSAGKVDYALKTFHRIIKTWDVLDNAVYIVFIESLKKSEYRRKKIAEVLDHMQKVVKQINPDERLCSAIGSLLENTHDPQLTEQWFKLLFSFGHFGENLINANIHYMAKQGNFQKAFHILANMEKLYGQKPTTSTFNTLLDKLQNESQLKQVLAEMDKQNVDKDITTYNIRIKFLCRAGKRDEALALFKKIKQLCQAVPSLTPNPITLSTLARAFADVPEAGDYIYTCMRQLRLKTDRLLAVDLLNISPKYRDYLIQGIIDETLDLKTLNEDYPELFPELVRWMKSATHDYTASVETALKKRRIFGHSTYQKRYIPRQRVPQPSATAQFANLMEVDE